MPELLRPLNSFAADQDRPCLICLPYSGGSDRIFRPWAAQLEEAGIGLVAARLPGRADRVAEAPFTRLDELVARLMEETVARMSGRVYALYGHSMGAVVACALTHAVEQRALPTPARLFVAAHAAPQAARTRLPPADATDEEFVSWLSEFGLVEAAVIANDELLSLVLPGLRADFALVRDHGHEPRPSLAVPLTVYGGRDDPIVDATALSAWTEAAVEPPEIRVFPGGHRFPWENPRQFTPVLVADVVACVASRHQAAGA